jgi:hypothetical protein
LKALDWKNLVYFMAGVFMRIWYTFAGFCLYLWSIGINFPILVCGTKNNLATLAVPYIGINAIPRNQVFHGPTRVTVSLLVFAKEFYPGKRERRFWFNCFVCNAFSNLPPKRQFVFVQPLTNMSPWHAPVIK